MGKKVKEYKAGDFIFAKVKGYPAWPARVQKPNGKKYFVYFYGTGETANLPPNQIFDYAENKDKFLTKTVKRKDFNDGVQQIDHDFTNNIPLEEVIGVPAAEPMDTSANDTGVESADATLDETADGDAAADTTVDESNATAPPEDSDDGALVIDEGKKAKKPAAKATPKAAPTPKTPRGKAKKDDAKKDEEKTGDEEKNEELVSRSGRKIRPKRFVDEQTEENATLPSPAAKKRRGSPAPDKSAKEAEPPKRQYQALTQSELEDIKESVMIADAEKDHILIACLPSGQYVGVKLFQSKPSFKGEAARLQWFRQAAANAVTLRSQLEKGHITVASVSAQIETDLNLSEEERANLEKEREIDEKKSRVQFLKTEMKLIELDAKIKSCLSLEKADAELCLKLIDELLELEVKSLMLLKHPTCVETVRRMRAYVGNAPSWELTAPAARDFARRAQDIRRQAERAYRRFKELYSCPDGLSFWEYFSARVQTFNSCTARLSADELLEMVHEPPELSQPSATTMRAAIDAANSEPAAAEEKEEDKSKEKPPPTPKKRGAPAKNKKAPPTPAKTSKRGSTRNKPQPEAEKPEEETENSEEKEKPEENAEKPMETSKTEQEKTVESSGDKSEAEEKEVTEKNKEESTEKATEKESSEAIKEGEEATNKEVEKETEAEAEKPAENGDAEAKKDAEKVTKEAEKAENEPKAKGDEKATKVVEESPKKAKKAAKEAEKATKETEKAKKETEKATKEAEKATKEAEKATKDAEKATKESEKATKESEKATKESEKAAKEAEKATKDAEKATKNADKVTKDVEKATKGAEKATKESEKATKDAEKVTKEAEKAEGEPRAKRVRESTRKEAPPPIKSPLKRKAKS